MSDLEKQPDETQQNDISSQHIEFRNVSNDRSIKWLIDAWKLFKLNPGAWMGSIFVMSTILLVLLVIPFVQLFAFIAAPVFTAGLMNACQRLQNNQEFNVNHLFSGFHGELMALLKVGVIYLGFTFLCSFLAVEIATAFGHQIVEIDQQQLAAGKVDLQVFVKSLLLPMLIMFVLMIPVLMAYWFAPALVELRGCKPAQAMKISLQACVKNIKPFLVFAMLAFMLILFINIIVTLTSAAVPILGFLMSLISSLIIMSIMFASIYTSFIDIFAIQQPIPQTEEGPDSIIL